MPLYLTLLLLAIVRSRAGFVTDLSSFVATRSQTNDSPADHFDDEVETTFDKNDDDDDDDTAGSAANDKALMRAVEAEATREAEADVGPLLGVCVQATHRADCKALLFLWDDASRPMLAAKRGSGAMRGYCDWTGRTGRKAVTCDKAGRVKRINLSHNALGGSIPWQLDQLSALNWLDLSYNDLTGSIPASLGKLSNLNGLLLNGNHLTGPIPSRFSGLMGLKWLAAGNNKVCASAVLSTVRCNFMSVLVLCSLHGCLAAGNNHNHNHHHKSSPGRSRPSSGSCQRWLISNSSLTR